MSDLMLHGVLNMPLSDDPAELDLLTWVQFRDRARQASAEITRLQAALAASETRERAIRAAVVEQIRKPIFDFIANDVLPCYDVDPDLWIHDPEAGDSVAALLEFLATPTDHDALEEVRREARKVKPLEWTYNERIGCWRARSIVGEYEVDSRGDWTLLTFFGDYGQIQSGGKDACDADNKRRILSALSDTTDKGER